MNPVTRRPGHADRGFTLVELLISISIVLVLSAVALPTFRSLLGDQKLSRSARSVAAFLDVARNRAIAEGRVAGVRLEPLDGFSDACIRLRQLTGVPAYRGEAADATVALSGSGATRTLTFDNTTGDHQLLTLADNSGAANSSAPFRNGDLIEIKSGVTFPMEFLTVNATTIIARIDLTAPNGGISPISGIPTSGVFPYRIYRQPSPSTSQTIDLARGVAIDLSVSGRGASGVGTPINILFNPDGSVQNTSEIIYLCVGSLDGVLPGSELSDTDQARGNLKRLDSVWITINPSTGRVTAAPNAETTATGTLDATAVRDARQLARLGDTLDGDT